LWVNPTTQRALDNINKQLNLYDRKKEKMKKARSEKQTARAKREEKRAP
jgi:uncharacterized membrane protein YukC